MVRSIILFRLWCRQHHNIMDTQRAMADLPELQRRLLERSRLLGFEPYADAPMRVRDRPSSEQDSSSGDDGDEACAVEAPVSRPRGKTCASGSPDHDPPEPDRLGNTRWCTCGQCVPMPTTLESICCREIQAAIRRQPSGCVTEHPYFHTLCLDEVVLSVVLQMFEDHGLLAEETGFFVSKPRLRRTLS
ncbi:uncharacterized protein LOC119405926 [Rhipicephalus sanguineus]|uniref:uncharacterized protein LOC119405926 n=1 Tax=Rhipicephalus sanguineus TaxID=34632 RepID=UPI0020C42178|nr:uncharacterized protein LOC119405926 [Rhipicephalus sanguineus]